MKQILVRLKITSGKRMATQFIALALLLLLPACADRDVLSGDIKDLNLNFSFLDTASYQIVPLETLGESKIGNIDQVLFEDDSYAFWMSSEDEYQILVTDSTGTVLRKHNPIPDKYSYLITLIPGFFSKGKGNQVYYIPIWEDKIFQITAENIELKFDLGFSRHIVSSLDEIELLGSNRTQDRFSCFYSLLMNEKGQFVTSIRHLSEYYGETLGIPIHIFGNISTGKIEGGRLATSVADFRNYGLGIGYPVGQAGEYFVRAISPGIVKSVYPDDYGYLQQSDNPCLFFYKVEL